MTFLNDKRIRHFGEHLPEFTKKVNPIELLPYLHCLTRSSKEEIECKQLQNSRSMAAMKMYEHLTRMDNWWGQLLDALRNNHQHQLADKLEEVDDETSTQCTDRKLKPAHASRKSHSTRSRVYKGDTKYKDLPARVSSILKVMDSQDVESNWEAMAAHFKYTNDEVTRIKCNQNETSCTKKLLEDWSQREDATLQNLLMALQELERFDLLEQVQKVTGYCLPDIEKGKLDCDEHGRCTLLPTEKMFSDEKEVTSVKLSENAVTCQSEHDQPVSCCPLDPTTRDGQAQGEPILAPSDEGVGRPSEQTLSSWQLTGQGKVSEDEMQHSVIADSPKTAEENKTTQTISMKSRPDAEGPDLLKTNNGNNNNNNYTNEYDGTHISNVNTSSYPKTMKDKIINKLPFVGISALGIGAILVLAKIK